MANSYATENWLRKKAREKDVALARAEDLLKRVRDGEPYTSRDLETVLADLALAGKNML